jgi:hypothetical protein
MDIGGRTKQKRQKWEPLAEYTPKNSKKFWEELFPSFPLIRHGPHRKRRLQQFFVAAGTSLPSCYLATIGGYTERPTDTCPTILLLLHVFIAAGTFLPSRCLAVEGGIHFPSLCLATIGVIQAHRMMGGIYEVHCSDGLGCHAILVHTKFHKDRLRHSEVNGGRGLADTQTAWR